MKPSRFAVLFSLSVLLVLVAGLAGAPASQAQDVQVTSADPPAAEQGTITLDVTIKGKGFKNGALAKWFVTGTTNPGGVTVNSTTFISGSELRANITVADDATIASFDILVTNTNGRSGKGTELFAVVAKGSLNGSSIDACTNRAWTAPSLSPIVNYCPASGAGCLDPSFGSGGVLYPGIAGNLANLWAAAFQTDPVTSTQKMLIGGQDNAYQAVVSRIGLDGQMDPTFGVSGMAVVSPQTTPVSDYVRDIAVQADGKILAIWGFGIFRVTRLNANGSLDTAFGAGGHAAVSNFGSCAGLTSNAVDVQSDGKIVMAGGSTDCGWTLARLNSNGTLDSTFGNGGTVLYKPQSKGPGAGSVGASTVTIQNVSGEDRILAAGTSSLNKKGLDFGLARFRSNGTLDTTFGPGGAGIVNTDFFGLEDRPNAMAVDWAGRVVLAGRTQNDSCLAASQSAIARYTPNGLADATFGDLNPSTGQRTGRTAVNVLSASEGLNDVAVQSDGSVVGVGTAMEPFQPDGNKHYSFVTARWTPDGLLDPVFGDRGVALTNPSPNPGAQCGAVVLAPVGRITAFGSVSSSPIYVRGIWIFLGLLP